MGLYLAEKFIRRCLGTPNLGLRSEAAELKRGQRGRRRQGYPFQHVSERCRQACRRGPAREKASTTAKGKGRVHRDGQALLQRHTDRLAAETAPTGEAAEAR